MRRRTTVVGEHSAVAADRGDSTNDFKRCSEGSSAAVGHHTHRSDLARHRPIAPGVERDRGRTSNRWSIRRVRATGAVVADDGSSVVVKRTLATDAETTAVLDGRDQAVETEEVEE